MSGAARTREIVAADERARRVVQQLFDRPVILEAGAGTGKTTALVARVVAWSIGAGWELAAAAGNQVDATEADRSQAENDGRVAAQVLGRVVAITFTEAAAAQMNERLGEALLEIAANGVPVGMHEEFLPTELEERRRRVAALQGALDHLVVSTIHAYCRRLLGAYPLEAGLHPRLEVDADGALQRELVREVLTEKLASAYAGRGDDAYVELAGRGGDPRALEKQVLDYLEAGLGSASLALDPLAAEPVSALCTRLESALSEFRSAAEGCLHEVAGSAQTLATASRIDDTATQLDKQRARLAGPDARYALDEVVAWAKGTWGDGELRKLKSWAGHKFGAKESAALGERRSGVAAAAAPLVGLISHLRRLDLGLLELARPILRELLAEVEERMRTRGVATFSSLLTAARDLLNQHPAVAERVRSGIDQLLVDEFQDTDRCQCNIVGSIALEGPEGDRPGLLLVGDPKQSIYGWRNADLAAYDAFLAGVLAEGGVRERLSVNYRSVSPILEEVERAIEPVMEECLGLQPAFQPLVACDASNEAPGLPSLGSMELRAVEYWVSAQWDDEAEAPRQTSAVEATELEAMALANDLRALHDEGGVEWKAIGVLFRSRTDWEVYLAALRAAGVPHVVEGDRNYYRRREIIEAAALVRCVVDPNDHVALLTWLRSASVGVPDVALLPLWSRRLPERMGDLHGAAPVGLASLCDDIEAVARNLPGDIPGLSRIEGWERNLIDAVSWLGPLRECFERDPSDVFVERLRSVSLFEATEAARYLGAWRSANLERFFAELSAALSEGSDASATLRQLRRALTEQEEASEARPIEVDGDSVHVMTWHGAKGLDFEHVYLMQLHKGSERSAFRDTCVGEFDGRVEYRAFGAPTLAWDGVEVGAAKVDAAERVRMLYVAMTRAKRRLVLAGLWRRYQKRAGNAQAVALLEERNGGVPDLAELMPKLVEQGADRFADASGALWVFPALVVSPPLEGEEEAVQGSALPSRKQIAESAVILRRAGVDAARRMQRRLGGRASSAGHEAFSEDLAAGEAARFDSLAGVGDAETARRVGTALHRILEELDLDGQPADALAGASARLAELLEGREDSLEVAEALLGRIANGALLRRLFELAPHVVARELPVLLPPEVPGTDEATASPDPGAEPLGYVAGAIDLVYRDPTTERIVIADYKTDRLREADLQPAALRYRAQGQVYQRALRESLGLDYTPRFELWFLSADRVFPS